VELELNLKHWLLVLGHDDNVLGENIHKERKNTESMLDAGKGD
jgi:hypothetical protein